jgi:hypothetical protein
MLSKWRLGIRLRLAFFTLLPRVFGLRASFSISLEQLGLTSHEWTDALQTENELS